MKYAIVNTTLVMTDHLIPNGAIIVEDGRIADFGRMKDLDLTGLETVDAKGGYTGPGLIDVHTHAGDGTFFYEDPELAAAKILEHGVTDVLPALYFNMNAQRLVECVEKIRAAMPKAKNIIGLYMEAPYMNPKFGCDRTNNPWGDVVAKEKFAPVVDAAYDIARVWCVAPERENLDEFIDYVREKNPNARFSVAHSEAEPWQIERLIPKGLCNATHHMNATGTLQKYPECRTPCVDETALYNDSMYVELICDKVGIHVDPYNLRLVRKIKGDDKVILIADAFVEHGPIPPGYEGADDINFDNEGEIAGSNMILDGACRNMMVHTGASLCQAFKFGSTNPAAMLGLTDRGMIKRGYVANLITVDHEFSVQSVYLGGEKIR